MTHSVINSILFRWTGQSTLESIETSELEQWVAKYPYSPSLQFLLTKKYELANAPEFVGQLQKTTSFFPSALQLHQWLNNKEVDAFSAPMDEKLTNIISEQFAQFKDADGQEPLMHEQALTQLQKDYFAAQGIEIDLSTIPQDKFTKQLRSFTAWLKVLKHPDAAPNLAEMGEDQEKAITAIAEKANKTDDVITESMAEIWEKQGNNRRAIATYQKLSFIFPEKSVYFASRIEQLKQKK